jgi:nucleoside-diphosphate-sugar epimerase
MRNATAYGVSPRLRVDLVLNNLVGWAHTTGVVRILSDGTPWRPLIHIEDIARATAAMLEAPEDVVRGQAFNVGTASENYQVRELADIVEASVPGTRVVYAANGGPDPRCYRVDCDAFREAVPEFAPRWDVPRGVAQLAEAFQGHGLALEELEGPRFSRIAHLLLMLERGEVDSSLRR